MQKTLNKLFMYKNKLFIYGQATTKPKPNIVLLDINQKSTRQENRTKVENW
jgi:hypothetical protein